MTLCDGHAMVGAGELIAVTMIAVVAHSGPLHCTEVQTASTVSTLPPSVHSHQLPRSPHSLLSPSQPHHSIFVCSEERPASCQDLSGDSLDTGSEVDIGYLVSSSRRCLVTPDLLNVGSEEAAITTSGSLQVSAV